MCCQTIRRIRSDEPTCLPEVGNDTGTFRCKWTTFGSVATTNVGHVNTMRTRSRLYGCRLAQIESGNRSVISAHTLFAMCG